MLPTEMEKIGVCGLDSSLLGSKVFLSLSYSRFVCCFCSSVKIYYKILHLEYDISSWNFSVVVLPLPPLLPHMKNYVCMHIRVFHFHAYEYKFVVTTHSLDPNRIRIFSVFICNKDVCLFRSQHYMKCWAAYCTGSFFSRPFLRKHFFRETFQLLRLLRFTFNQ